ncbi:uncharacterized protein B0H18DRAFT_672113 [Fomitopsis serialis]|uniref:uncharacterized protein n=1 Tax=Fomitopsis serialis TaxID=139415 RepID=UPI002007A797|nr:uncharacterized protein B0H18DRAFT_672113 [Neoantrodia serialis]KAH9932935.1 hypothetical protein B0H18DRAFT_672113 [Neoantrodia serialis]
MAFGSQRMAGEGKEHIRAWWYRGAAKNPADLEEGEIEEGVVEAPVAPQAANKKMSKKDKKAEKRKAQALQPKQNKPRAPPALPKLPPANGSRAFPNYNRQQSVASTYSGVPMSVPLPLPQPPPIASSSGPSNYVPKTSPPAQPPQPAAQPPSSPYGYRGWADHLEQVEKYGVMSSDDGSEYEGPSAEAERSWYYSAGPRRRDPSYLEEEQAMDLESDDEDLPDPKEEHFIQESRYGVWGEPATGADVTAADSASIASSREASAERGQEERMRVDDASPATTRTPPATEHAVTVPQSLPSSSRPKPEVTIPDLPVQTSRPQPLSPSAYTMVEPPAASVPASALTIVPTAPSTSATEPTHPIAVASPSTLTSPVSALKPLPAAPLVTSLKDPSLELPKVPLPQPVVSQRSESAAPALAESVPVVSAKRTLQEKQRELEERIARAKEELAQKNMISRAGSSRHTSPEEENDKPAATSSRAGEEAISSPTEILSTQELRRSALQSRKKAGIASIPSAGITQEKESTVALSDTSTVVGDDAPSAAAVPKGSAINFDELAVSFITETLQTMQPSPRSDSPPAAAAPVHVSQPAPPTAPATPQPRTFTQSHTLAKSSQAAEKVLLAARQKRLEQHIAETKVLMAKLTTARSKAEKENILGMLRERQRAMDGDMKADAPLKPVSSSPPSSFATNGYSQPFKSQATHAWKTHWPEPSRDAMILVISDDEDDD